MRIALCLHGLFNSATDSTSLGLDGYNYIKKHILDKGDVDVFVHSWQPELTNVISDLYNPKLALYEQQRDFTQLINERGLNGLGMASRPPFSVLSHFYSIQQAFQLLDSSNEKYDIVIKSRFDLGRINRISVQGNPTPAQFINFQTDIVNDKLYQADWSSFNEGPSDVWFYGSQSIMKPFSTIYNELEPEFIMGSDYSKFAESFRGVKDDISNAVIFYKWWMIKNNLWDNTIKLKTIWE
jgi:hypothetical protein